MNSCVTVTAIGTYSSGIEHRKFVGFAFTLSVGFAQTVGFCRTIETREIPLLGQGGVAAPLSKCCEASEAGADGVVGSSHRLIGCCTNHPVRSDKEASQHFS
jgi:hypothetical protein